MPPPAQPSGAVGSPSLRKEPVKELTAQGDPSGGSTMTWGPQEQGWGVPGCRAHKPASGRAKLVRQGPARLGMGVAGSCRELALPPD